jgi:predicted PurR-regulated permease PerM
VLVALLATSVWPSTVLVAAFFVLYRQLENYAIAPPVLRGPVKLSQAAVLLAALIGGARSGLIGALTAIPVAAKATVLLVRAPPAPGRGRRRYRWLRPLE